MQKINLHERGMGDSLSAHTEQNKSITLSNQSFWGKQDIGQFKI